AISALHAQETVWIGGTDFLWSTDANWDTGAAPVGVNTALLNDTTTDRTIIYDAGANSTVDAIEMTQTSAFTNKVSFQRFTVVNQAITLSASGGGTTIMALDSDSAGANQTLRANGGIDLQTGGVLELNFGANTSSSSYVPKVAGDVSVSGGTLSVGALPSIQTSGSGLATVDGSLSISSGTIYIDNSTDNGSNGDVRLTVTGNFNATGGSLVTSGSGKGLLLLGGTSNSWSDFTFDPSYGVQLGAEADQSLTGLSTTNGLIYLRGSGIKTIATATGATIGNLQFINSKSSLPTAISLKLGSDMTQSAGSQLIQEVTNSHAGVAELGIDVDGHVFDMTPATGTSSSKGTDGVWRPNTTTSYGSNWTLSSTTSGGQIKALGFDFSAPDVTVSVGSGLTLNAAGGDGTANNLGSGSALDSASVFQYSGGASTANAATLTSGRSIGELHIENGALAIIGTTFNAAGGIRVDDGGVLDLTSTTVSTDTITIEATSTGSGQITVASGYTYQGDLQINFTSHDGSTDIYTIFGLSGGTSGDFSTVTLTGLYNLSLTLDGTDWTGSNGEYSFDFSQATGLLTISAIPEPSTMALLAGVAGLGLAVARRFRRAD
ncbi:MAG: PEP-CTERM sorting domain-containing protein, partial [Puniceicoccales bacterium]